MLNGMHTFAEAPSRSPSMRTWNTKFYCHMCAGAHDPIDKNSKQILRRNNMQFNIFIEIFLCSLCLSCRANRFRSQ